MTSVGKLYQKRIGKLTNKRATWEPGDRLALGDVGVEKAGLFRVETTLQKLGINWRPTRGKVVPRESKSSVKWSVKGANAGADSEFARVDLELEFKDAGSVVFEACGLRHLYIGNLHAVTQGIIERRRAGEWNREWTVIDQIWRADTASVLVAGTSGTKVDVVGGLPSLRTFVDVDVEYRLEQRSGELNRYERLSDATLLYTCRRLHWTRRKVAAVDRGPGLTLKGRSVLERDGLTNGMDLGSYEFELSLDMVDWDEVLSSWD